MTDEEHVWACALVIEQSYGENAAAHVAERIGALTAAADLSGVERWKAIAARLQMLKSGPGGTGPGPH